MRLDHLLSRETWLEVFDDLDLTNHLTVNDALKDLRVLRPPA